MGRCGVGGARLCPCSEMQVCLALKCAPNTALTTSTLSTGRHCDKLEGSISAVIPVLVAEAGLIIWSLGLIHS